MAKTKLSSALLEQAASKSAPQRSAAPVPKADAAEKPDRTGLVNISAYYPAEVKASPNIRVLSIAHLIGEAISRTAAEESVSSLFFD